MLEKGFFRENVSIELIGFHNFEEKIIHEKRPVLLLCMPWTAELEDQINVLENISKIHGEALRVCVLEDELIGPFKERFAVSGTPTFLIFAEGAEKNRTFGLATQEILMDFLSQTLLLF